MRVVLLRTLWIAVLAITTGCGTVKFKDVSSIPPYSEAVGLTVKSKKEVILHGWTEEDFTVKNPVFYSFQLPPGTNNRFVKSRSNIQPGLEIEIVAVEKCVDCYFNLGPRIKFRVALKNFRTEHNLPVYLEDSFLVEKWGSENEPTKYNHGVFEIGS
jgi:hypothetical protein